MADAAYKMRQLPLLCLGVLWYPDGLVKRGRHVSRDARGVSLSDAARVCDRSVGVTLRLGVRPTI